jgi:hypothetical protein
VRPFEYTRAIDTAAAIAFAADCPDPRPKRSAPAARSLTRAEEGAAAATTFADLNRYEATTHFNGQSTVELDGDRATGESYTIAHHLFSEDGDREIMIAALRYLDAFAKIDGRWYFAERKLVLDWSVTRPSTPGS